MQDGQDGNEHGLDPSPEISGTDKGNEPGVNDHRGGPDGGAAPATDDPIGGADGGQLSVYKPEGLVDHLIGQTDQETIDRLMRENKGFRDKQAKGPQVPEAPDAYQFNWSDKVKGQGSIAEDDAAVTEFRKIAHEHGYTQEQIDAIPKFFDHLVEKGVIEKPIDTSEMLRSLAPEGYRGTPDQIEAKGAERLGLAEKWVGQLTPQQGFDDAMKSEMMLLTTSAAGVKVIETLMKSGMNPSATAGGQAPGQKGVSKSDLEKRVADPRNDSFGEQYDPNFAEETKNLFRQLHGE